MVNLLKTIVLELCWRFCGFCFQFLWDEKLLLIKCKIYRLGVRNPASGLLQICHELKKWQWSYKLPRWHHRQNFWDYFVSLVTFSYWYKFHVNTIVGSGVMTVFFCKGLTRNLKIWNTPVWALSNIWRLGQVRDTKFSKNVSNIILLNATKYQGYSFHRFWVIKGKPTGREGGGKITPSPFHRLGLIQWGQ